MNKTSVSTDEKLSPNPHLIVCGHGRPLLFLHGYLSSKESFSLQINYFSKYFKVFAPDMAGFNGRLMPYPYALSDYARDVSRLIDRIVKEEGEKVNVVAHSFGARVLFKLLPDTRIDKIVLTGAAGIKPRFSIKKSLRVARYKIRKKLGLDVSRFGSSDYKALDPVMKQSFVKIVGERLENRIKRVKKPCLIVSGTLDTETPLYTAKRLNKLITSSRLITIRKAGHFAFIDDAHAFNLIVKEFLL